MKLKRLYDHSGDEPVVSGIQVLYAGPIQHFSTRLVEGAIEEGWMTMEDGLITIHDEEKPLVYKILRGPGRYDGEVINYFDCRLVKGKRKWRE